MLAQHLSTTTAKNKYSTHSLQIGSHHLGQRALTLRPLFSAMWMHISICLRKTAMTLRNEGYVLRGANCRFRGRDITFLFFCVLIHIQFGSPLHFGFLGANTAGIVGSCCCCKLTVRLHRNPNYNPNLITPPSSERNCGWIYWFILWWVRDPPKGTIKGSP